MAIYTRTGDKGETSLANGQRVSKASDVVDFVGALDRLNSSIGMCVAYLVASENKFGSEIEVLEEIQGDLFKVGAIAVGASIKFDSSSEVKNIEKTIDDYEKLLPRLTNFILPGGSVESSHLHHARTVVRDIERKLVGLESESVMVFAPYINRLSDLLFVMARYVNKELGVKETIWKN